MTVAQLIKRLQKEDPKRLVILSSDSEGNSFSTLGDITPLFYSQADGEVQDDDSENGKPCVVLWP